MTDLRDRIAKALFRHGFENLVWEDESDDLRKVLLAEADAVIAELRKLMVNKADEYVPSYADVLRDFIDHILGKADDE